MTITWSRQAQDDLAAIRGFIARDSERYTQPMIDRILTATDRLLSFPRSGRIVPEVGDESLREILVGFYRVVYLALAAGGRDSQVRNTFPLHAGLRARAGRALVRPRRFAPAAKAHSVRQPAVTARNTP